MNKVKNNLQVFNRTCILLQIFPDTKDP